MDSDKAWEEVDRMDTAPEDNDTNALATALANMRGVVEDLQSEVVILRQKVRDLRSKLG